MNRGSQALVAFLIGVAIGLLCGAKACSTHTKEVQYDTLTVQGPVQYKEGKTKLVFRTVYVSGKVDTIYIPVELAQKDTSCKPFVAISDTLRMYDSAKVVTEFHYPEFRHSVSYTPPPTKILVRTEREKPKDWSFGIGLFYGAVPVDNNNVQLKLGVGVSIQKKLFEF